LLTDLRMQFVALTKAADRKTQSPSRAKVFGE
jgi:hypothetical protein